MYFHFPNWKTKVQEANHFPHIIQYLVTARMGTKQYFQVP